LNAAGIQEKYGRVRAIFEEMGGARSPSPGVL
jgi:hypothetical protein